MKKRSRFVQVWMLVILMISMLLTISACSIDDEGVAYDESYQIEHLTSEWIMIKGGVSTRTVFDYSNAFAEGLKYLDKDYTIIEIVPINARSAGGSMTKALYVKIEPKQ